MERWITIEAQRALYVARGRDVILCDDHHSGPVTIVLKLSEAELTKLRNNEQVMPPIQK